MRIVRGMLILEDSDELCAITSQRSRRRGWAEEKSEVDELLHAAVPAIRTRHG